MSGSTVAERQVHEMNLLARLGPPVGGAVPIPPPPLKQHLFTPGEKSSVLDLSCSAENFYPGFLLLSRLASEAQTPRA